MKRILSFSEYRELLKKGLPEDVDGKIGEFFWVNTKLSRKDGYILGRHIGFLSSSAHFVLRLLHPFIIFQAEERLKLNYYKKLDFRLKDVLESRRTPRKLKRWKMNYREISSILYYSYGICQKIPYEMKNEFGNISKVWITKRPCPSAGALYPLEIFVIPFSVNGLAPALYHYNVFENTLDRLSQPMKEEILRKRILNMLSGATDDLWLAFILLVALPNRQTIKYGQRAFRYMLQESGHLAQNICLLSTGLGYGVVPIGGFYDTEIENFLYTYLPEDLEFIPVYPLLMGKPEEQEDEENIDAAQTI